MTVILNMSLVTPSKAIPDRAGGRPHRSPPRNRDGEMTCTHDECRDDQPVFRRLCEYNKHMDKHERPYKCSNPACRKNPGFTYAGGLLRHQREVHSMHRTKDPFFCPHSSCNRSTGTGFSRRENLEEHLRRRHSGFNHEGSTEPVGEEPPIAQLEPLPLDRRRRAETEGDEEQGSGNIERWRAQVMALQQENERMRAELSRKDQLLAEVSQENRQLRGFLPAKMPTHAIYQTSPPG